MAAAGILVVLLSMLAPGVGAAAPCGSTGSFQNPAACLYDLPGTDSFTVPTGVTSLLVDLYGGQGGGANGLGGRG
jgi:hypothetical protein